MAGHNLTNKTGEAKLNMAHTRQVTITTKQEITKTETQVRKSARDREQT